MKKVSKKLQSTGKEELYSSLNGKMLKKIKGGTAISTNSGNTDRVCPGGCGPSAAFLIVKK